MYKFLFGATLLCLVASAAATGYQPESPEYDVATMFKTLIARASSTSEVLTLNLTNLLILGGLFFVLVFLGFGFSNFGLGRSNDDALSDVFLSRDNLLVILTYLNDDMVGDYGCLNRMMCDRPERAKSYLEGGKVMLKMAKVAKKFYPYKYNRKYEDILYGIQEAVETKLNHGTCERYTCSISQ